MRREWIEGGNYLSLILRRGDVLRLVDLYGDACVQLLLFRKDNPAERLNVADTVKVQWQAYLAAGALLLSDMGRVLATVVGDSSGCHDCICGGTTARTAAEKWGDGSASGPTPNARDLLVLGAAKHGLGRRDIGPCINLFTGATVEGDGRLRRSRDSMPEAHVDLRFELDVIVVLANTPHPLDPRPEYVASAVAAVAWRAQRVSPEPVPVHDARASAGLREHRTPRRGAGRMTAPIVDVTIPARAPWAHAVHAGELLRIVDLGGNQAVDFLMYDLANTTHRYSAADTVTAQGNIFLVAGSVLRSNESVPMMTLEATSCAYHGHHRRSL